MHGPWACDPHEGLLGGPAAGASQQLMLATHTGTWQATANTCAGVIVYAAITDSAGPQFADQHEVFACARGARGYPWERRESMPPALARSRLRAQVLQCLSRNPTQRPTAEQLTRAIDRISHATVTQHPGQQGSAGEADSGVGGRDASVAG